MLKFKDGTGQALSVSWCLQQIERFLDGAVFSERNHHDRRLVFVGNNHGYMVITDFLHGAGKVGTSCRVADRIHESILICACTE